MVDNMKEGEWLDVSIEDLRDIPSFEHNFATFNPADRVLGNICGSAYTHSYETRMDGRAVTFKRHKDTGEVRYKEPDHEYRLQRLER